MYNGIINVYKEKGYTSFDVVARMRGICGQKKIGHTGTLDPDAEGVLPVCLGKATKVCDMLTDSDKVYRAVMQLGIETDTQDLTGTVLSACEVPVLTETEIRDVIRTFQGEIMQVPPVFSACKVEGKRAYDLARKGQKAEEVQLKAKPLRIDEIELLEADLGGEAPSITIRVVCSKGTYIRALARDIGEALNSGAHLTALRRTRVGEYGEKDCFTLESFEEWLAQQDVETELPENLAPKENA